ncbi:hypothetical protein [Paenirhodobacter sp.]|uniref:hypothetical protein n=1 Tax=Paenirhodobacter sp. TaxID=1965326 RepID=UPI003B3EFBB0
MLVLFKTRWLALGLAFAIFACTPLASPFSEQAYRNATSLKARSLALVVSSDEPFLERRKEVASLLTDIDSAYEYARGLPRNEVVTEQWRMIRDPNAGLVGTFAAEWARRERFGSVFREEFAGEIAFAFDTLICVEITKKAADDCSPDQGGQ